MKILIVLALAISPLAVNAQSFIPAKTNDTVTAKAVKALAVKVQELNAQQLVVDHDSIYLIHYYGTGTNSVPYAVPEYLGLKHVLDPADNLFKGNNFYYVKDPTFFKH